MNEVQLEFPFTRNGQFQAYNNKQLGAMYQLYRNYLDASCIPPTDQNRRAWEQIYIDSGMAAQFADDNRWMFETKPVEYYNDKVLMRWNSKPIASHSIEDYLRGN